MPDLFISYAREDLDTARSLADALQAEGLNVWWDRALVGGGDFARDIERQLSASPVALVLWSPWSVQSDFVRDESARARDAQKLLPVRIADVTLPLGFGTLHTLDLLDWDGDADDEAFQALLTQVRGRLSAARPGRPPAPPSPPDPSASFGPSQRRWRRRLLLGAGTLALGGLGTGAWWHGEQTRREAEARERLDKALKDHFSQPPQLESAQAAYADALSLDPTLARAHYFMGHLYVQLMLRGSPPPAGDELQALRGDALSHFDQALLLAQAEPSRLDGSQRLVADRQRTELAQADEATALVRSTLSATDGPPAATATPPASTAASAPGPSRAPAATSATPPTASPPVTAPLRPPRQAASAQQQAAAQALAQALFSPERDRRLSASATLTLNPGQAGDALGAVLARAGAALRQAPDDPATREGLAATWALLNRASPATLREQSATVQALLTALPATWDPASRNAVNGLREALARAQRQAPVAYLQIAHERQRGVAQRLAQRLREAGYEVPEIENTGEARAPKHPSVRSQGASDPGLARWCQQALDEAVGTASELTALRNARPASDTYELWFDAALCAPAGREAPGCATPGT